MNKLPRLIVFAKAPLAGFAKTRLIPALGERGAASLAERMLQHTLQECVRADLGNIELCAAPDVGHEYWRTMPLPPGVALRNQGEGNLGRRLWCAAARAVNAGESALLLGTDCPQLTARRLRHAAAALGKSDAAIYPTRDGGYALLGLNRVEPALFENIDWSTEAVAKQTGERLERCGMRCEWLETLADIDEPEDLEYLPEGWRRDIPLSHL